jgi:hypothetical protein
MDIQGGCLCGKLRYSVKEPPFRVTICHCRFCQRATGSAYLVEPVFKVSDFTVIAGEPKTYILRSGGSGKLITINFCPECGKLYMRFERFPDVVGVFGGTFDDPNWFERSPQNARHIFLAFAQKGTIIPAGYNTFREHHYASDGSLNESVIYRDRTVIP